MNLNKMRPFNEEEIQVIRNIYTRYVKSPLIRGTVEAVIPCTLVCYSEDLNFTYCILYTEYNGETHICSGASKRNPTDKYNPITGRRLALRRAILNDKNLHKM